MINLIKNISFIIMEVNIFDKIYQIMHTYENLLKEKNTSSNNSFDVQNDQFFQFIFQNIHLTKNSTSFHSSSTQFQNKTYSEQNEKIYCNQSQKSSQEQLSIPKKNTVDNNSKNNLEKDSRKEEKNQENKKKTSHKNKEDNKQNIPSSSDNNDYFSDKTTGIENNINKDGADSKVKKYMKICYKKIILHCHPDKTKKNKDLYQEYFIKSQEYYENNFLIGQLYLFYLLQLKPPLLNSIIVNHIIIEIRHIQEKINEIK